MSDLREAAQALLDKLDAAKKAMDDVCLMSQIHGAPYSGPTIGPEKEALRAALSAEPAQPNTPHDAGSHNQRMTPALQRVIDAADKRERDRTAMPPACPTPTGCRENGCHGECIPAEPAQEMTDEQLRSVWNGAVCVHLDNRTIGALELHLRGLRAVIAADRALRLPEMGSKPLASLMASAYERAPAGVPDVERWRWIAADVIEALVRRKT